MTCLNENSVADRDDRDTCHLNVLVGSVIHADPGAIVEPDSLQENLACLQGGQKKQALLQAEATSRWDEEVQVDGEGGGQDGPHACEDEVSGHDCAQDSAILEEKVRIVRDVGVGSRICELVIAVWLQLLTVFGRCFRNNRRCVIFRL